MPLKENMKEIPKVWGKEVVLVNCPQYCGKFLILNKNAQSSYHYHVTKQETFYCLSGSVALSILDRDYVLTPFSRPKTILPGELHQFRGITKAVLLEISTHHDEEDVVRLTESIAGIADNELFTNSAEAKLDASLGGKSLHSLVNSGNTGTE